ncbi:cation-translocating P-type ATPase [Spiroplasma endosymbiont of Crioceris asparagi]|uniref:cation-translocating P-type ATPase n=1 Tax=Spiroplasma endosymbiont of Crioceris asparagi TaxID=3066286 RepID=UPI0030CE0B3E
MDLYPSNIDKKDILDKYNVTLEAGLSSQQVEENYNKFGKNEIQESKKESIFSLFIKTLMEPIQLILLFAALISFVEPLITKNYKFTAYIDCVVILLIVIIDSILELVQEIKTQKSVTSLKKLTKPKCVVIRNSMPVEITAAELTLGDIVLLEAGRYVPADLRLLDASNLTIDESNLTGESTQVWKTADSIQKETNILAEMKNIAFSSTFVTNGRAVGIVIKIGEETEIGKISKMIVEAPAKKTLLEKSIDKFTYKIAIISVLVGIIFFVGLEIVNSGKDTWFDNLMVSITLAIGLIPECLAAAISIALSVSTKRMVKNNMIVKKISVVESLGSVNVICTDKTGTLTQNKMTVEKIIINNEIVESGVWLNSWEDNEQNNKFIQSMILCNDSMIQDGERIGDPTELAFIDFSQQIGFDELVIRKKYKRLNEISFDSTRKMMTTINKIDDHNFVFSKGGVEQILQRCNRIFINNEIKKITKADINQIMQITASMSQESLRVMAFAYKEANNEEEKDLIFVSAVGMKDPVRPMAVETIKITNRENIKVVMITGDHPSTALSIARDLGLASEERQVMSAEQLDTYSKTELLSLLDHIRVFARVNPEHKVKIIKLFQEKGEVVSMTGDGVNDASSLAIADVGVAMGITGTDVAKDSADAILTDDNLFTIVNGIKEGRGVFQRIQKTIAFVMGVNIANIIVLGAIIITTGESFLNAVQILWINLIIESLLATTIGMGETEKAFVKNNKSKKKNSLLNGTWILFLKIVLISAGFSLAIFFITRTIYNNEFAKTATFFVMTTSPIFFVNTMRITSWDGAVKFGYKLNKSLLFSSIFAFMLNTLILFIPKINTDIFNILPTSSYNVEHIGIIAFMLIGSLMPGILIVVVDFINYIIAKFFQDPWTRNRLLSKQIIELED